MVSSFPTAGISSSQHSTWKLSFYVISSTSSSFSPSFFQIFVNMKYAIWQLIMFQWVNYMSQRFENCCVCGGMAAPHVSGESGGGAWVGGGRGWEYSNYVGLGFMFVGGRFLQTKNTFRSSLYDRGLFRCLLYLLPQSVWKFCF